tara:strand:+ start:22181 stop:22561 length:381 start_codon:yes stop_codon:yes gene_type:complete
MNFNNPHLLFLNVIVFFTLLCSCVGLSAIVDTQNMESNKINSYQGWWIYGDGEHIFKDEKTLNEYTLIFEKENTDNMTSLYLDICEVEYFPMEFSLIGYIKGDVNEGQNILVVSDFEILYVEGCGE